MHVLAIKTEDSNTHFTVGEIVPQYVQNVEYENLEFYVIRKPIFFSGPFSIQKERINCSPFVLHRLKIHSCVNGSQGMWMEENLCLINLP
jgi:hypothetical protein